MWVKYQQNGLGNNFVTEEILYHELLLTDNILHV